jgi:Holliday junction resolvase RusA-like endonuclease
MVLHDNHRLMPVRSKKGARLITAPEYRAAKTAAEWEIKRQWREPMMHGEVKLRALAYFPNRQKRDCGNYRKLCTDALTGIAYTDDSQLVSETWEKAGIDRENPRIEIEIVEAAA